MSVSQKVRAGVKERDGFRCAAEGPSCTRFVGLTIQHRANRGMGGSKLRDGFENLLTLCGVCNTLLEQDAAFAELGRQRGWKLASWQDPTLVAVWFAWAGEWQLLDAEGNWVRAAGRNPIEHLSAEVRAWLEGGAA